MLIPESQRTENGDSPKEELASVVEKGADAKGYVLTEYINDINRQNTQVLAEYGADNTLQRAYIYGDNRISVDKAEESSYYLYDGRTSVTGLLTEAGTLTNSYTYDPYGNLSSGTLDAVSYYGYNAESTNTNTGFQYLRARYYNPETGTFTTEDSDLGTKENPLTRNRYAYVGNNPLNYNDPTGHRASPAAAATVAGRGMSRIVKNLIKTRQSISGRNGERPPVRTFKMSSDYRNAQKAKTNARKAKNSASWISNITKRLREAHVKEFCTSKKEKVKTDWKEVGKTVLWGMTFSLRVNMFILGKGLYEIGKFLTSPTTRLLASSALEALGALMVLNGFIWAPSAAALGATGAGAPVVALDGSLIAMGTIALFVGEAGRRQAVDDMAEEARHGKETEGKIDVPDNVNYDSKQVGKKWGKHKADYPNMKNYNDYKNYADEVFESPDKIIYDAQNEEYFYIKDNDLLRLKKNGEFISLYPGAQSSRVTEAIANGGTIWP